MAGFWNWISVPKLSIFGPIFGEILFYIFYTFYFFKACKLYRIEFLENRTKMAGFRN